MACFSNCGEHRSVSSHGRFMPDVICFLLALAMGSIAAQSIRAQDSDDATGEVQTEIRKAAWIKLRGSAAQRLRAAESDQTAFPIKVRKVMTELEKFAETYPKTEESAIAMLNYGFLAASINDYAVAEKSLRKAIEQATDRELRLMIRYELGRIMVRAGQTAPAFSAKSLDERKISLSDFRGKVVLLDFWATWCMPCLAELPNIKRIYEKYHKKGLEIISISGDRDEESLRTFLEREKLDWPQIYNASLTEEKDIAAQYGADSIPKLILIGKNGKIKDVDLRGRALETAVKREIDVRDEVSRADPGHAAVGKQAPSLAVQEWLRGKPSTLNALKGKVVLLDIFQIICPGCHRAHPQLVRMQNRYRDDGLEVLGLAVAFEHQNVQTVEHIREYVDQKAYPYPVGIDQDLITTFRRYRAGGTPYTVLIDRKGRIRYLDFFRLNRVESMLQQLLNEEA